MRRMLIITTGLAICALSVSAGTETFRSIAGSAAKIEKDALSISQGLRAKTRDLPKIQDDIRALGVDIASLRQEIDKVDTQLAGLTDAQKKNWELIKLKAQLLMIFHDNKAKLSGMDLDKNRTSVRHLSDGIAKRAKLLQLTAAKL